MKKPIPNIHVLLLFFILVGSSCRKKEVKREEVRFDFLIPITVLPIKDTVRVGEELTLSSVFSDSVYDIKSKKNYFLPNFDWKPLIFIDQLIGPEKSISEQLSAGSNFEYNNIIGGFTRIDNIGANLKYVYENNQYKWVVTIKPKVPGVYSINFSNDFGIGEIKLPQEFAPNSSGVIRNPVIGIMRNYVNMGQTNYHILKQNCLVESPSIDSVSVWIYKNNMYTFVVK